MDHAASSLDSSSVQNCRYFCLLYAGPVCRSLLLSALELGSSAMLSRSETGYFNSLIQIPLVKSKKPKTDLSGTPRAPMPRNVEPMLCTLAPRPFDRPNWIFEIKWDGYRAIAEIDKSSVRLYSRKLKSLEGYFPQLIETLTKLKVEAVLDGEVVVLDEEGSFRALASSAAA